MNSTSLAVTGVPSWNLTPVRSFMVSTVGESRVQLWASIGWSLLSRSKRVSVSKIRRICVTSHGEPCLTGSRLTACIVPYFKMAAGSYLGATAVVVAPEAAVAPVLAPLPLLLTDWDELSSPHAAATSAAASTTAVNIERRGATVSSRVRAPRC